ncbi:MAG: 50S ribosomal protein L9, partial [candidate division WOR-3 bacterium]
MKVILLEDVENLGKAGSIVNVSEGYARNYLIPRNLAVPATESNIKALEKQQKLIKDKLEKEKQKIADIVKKLDGVIVRIAKKAGQEGKLFGSVTSREIEEELKKMNINVSRKHINIESPIKAIGRYPVKIKLPF